MAFVHIIGILSTALAATSSVGLDASREFQGVRSAAMGGAHRGLANSNDAMLMNPAGLATTSRFAGSIQYGFNNYYTMSRYHISIVDSKTGPAAGGLAYTYDRGSREGLKISLHRVYLGLAYSFNKYITIGTTNRYVNGYFDAATDDRQNISEYSTDMGVFSNVGFGLTLGLTYHSLIHTKSPQIATPGIGFGLGYSLGTLALAGDIVVDMRNTQHVRLTYNAGAEYFFWARLAARLGYKNQPFIGPSGSYASDNQLTAGIAYVDQMGSIDFTYAQSFNRTDSYDLIGSLQIFF